MSTGADCYFIEPEPDKWYYKIQQYPYGATEEYDTEGPFSTLDKAEKHLQMNYANPGGWSVHPFAAEQQKEK